MPPRCHGIIFITIINDDEQIFTSVPAIMSSLGMFLELWLFFFICLFFPSWGHSAVLRAYLLTLFSVLRDSFLQGWKPCEVRRVDLESATCKESALPEVLSLQALELWILIPMFSFSEKTKRTSEIAQRGGAQAWYRQDCKLDAPTWFIFMFTFSAPGVVITAFKIPEPASWTVKPMTLDEYQRGWLVGSLAILSLPQKKVAYCVHVCGNHTWQYSGICAQDPSWLEPYELTGNEPRRASYEVSAWLTVLILRCPKLFLEWVISLWMSRDRVEGAVDNWPHAKPQLTERGGTCHPVTAAGSQDAQKDWADRSAC